MVKSKNKGKQQGKLISPFFKYQIVILLSISLLAAIILRLYAANLPITDKWAESSNSADKMAISQQLKDIYKDKNGDLYLYGVDSYYFLDEAESIINGNNILDGRQSKYLLPYLEIFSYKALRLFDGSFTLIRAAFWLPFVFSLFSIILIFFIARKLTNNIGGFFASFLLAINPQFFTATQPGFTDTNFLNLFFSLAIVLLFFEGLEFKNKAKSIICFGLMIPSILLFRFAWSGYFYILAIMISFIVLYLLYFLTSRIIRSGSRKHILMLALVVIISTTSFFLLKDKDYIKSEVHHVKTRIGLIDDKTYLGAVSLTTELFSAKQAVEARGKGENVMTYIVNGYIYLALTLFSLLIILVNKRINNKSIYCLFILWWSMIMFFAGYKSIRFISFFAIPLSIMQSYGLSFIFSHLKEFFWNIKIFQSKSIVNCIVLSVLILAMIAPLTSSLSERSERTPSMNDLINDVGNNLMKGSSDNSIINLWWDKGYLYHHSSKRKVLMDNGIGGSFEPRMYWFSRALFKGNESESLAILKMLDCGQWPGDPKTNLSNDFCSPPESFILLDNGLILKTDLLLYFNDWYSNDQGPFQFPKIPSISAPSKCFTKGTDHMICGENFDVDMTNGETTYKGISFPLVIVGKKEIFHSDQTGPYSLLIYPEQSGKTIVYKSVLVRTELLNTLFVKLYFMKGKGLEHFELFSDTANALQGRIIIYRIDWGR